MSPGHMELWFFGWTPGHYRDNFILNPLPILVFVPLIVHHLQQVESSLINPHPIVVDVRPEQEVMFIKQNDGYGGGTTRMIRIHNVQGIDVWFKVLRIHEFQREYNLYYSLAKYKDGIPYSTLELAKRDFDNWIKEHWKEMVSYDFLLDIDAGNHHDIEFAYLTANTIRRYFNSFNVPYHLRFSGRGFHFVIPYKYFNDNLAYIDFNPDADENVYKFFMHIAMKLHSLFSEMIDTSIYDSRRVVRFLIHLHYMMGRNICADLLRMRMILIVSS
ncbi:hypothetical protein LCGC14_2951580, partial [marine sediment metagenome]